MVKKKKKEKEKKKRETNNSVPRSRLHFQITFSSEINAGDVDSGTAGIHYGTDVNIIQFVVGTDLEDAAVAVGGVAAQCPGLQVTDDGRRTALRRAFQLEEGRVDTVA